MNGAPIYDVVLIWFIDWFLDLKQQVKNGLPRNVSGPLKKICQGSLFDLIIIIIIIIDKLQQSSKYRVCGEWGETINHIGSKCRNLSQNK